MTQKNQAKKTITTRAENYSQWYLDVISEAGLAENSPVRGCMVIKPYGYAIWENIQKVLDRMFKETNVENAYFPIFIPQSFLSREAKHVGGFAQECAVVTHHRLEKNEEGKLVPAGKLTEPLIVRPTSETIMYDTFSKWIHSYRDLPLLINQWANVVRWEMRTRPFLRTMEFLWQEGHTAHSTKQEADERTLQMLRVYQDFVEQYLAIPVIAGRKTESEKFAGADYTTCIEAMMQDGKALQAGTSHMLGQNFAKGFNVVFTDAKEQQQYVWQTSWGLSTRIIGALIMSHSDDKGLVLPPKIAPIQAVIIPIWSNEEEKIAVMEKVNSLAKDLQTQLGIRVKVDETEERPGAKFFQWEKKGVPVRVEIGPKDLAENKAIIYRRDTGEKISQAQEGLVKKIKEMLDEIQKHLFAKAKSFQKENIHVLDNWEDFVSVLENQSGFISAHWCGQAECESVIKEKTNATIRCIPFDALNEEGQCIHCGQHSNTRVIFAKAY